MRIRCGDADRQQQCAHPSKCAVFALGGRRQHNSPSRSAPARNKATTRGDRSFERFQTQRSLPTRRNFSMNSECHAAARGGSPSASLEFCENFNGSFDRDAHADGASRPPVVSVLTVDRVRAPLMRSHSHSAPLAAVAGARDRGRRAAILARGALVAERLAADSRRRGL
jgi:hypothetical protein